MAKIEVILAVDPGKADFAWSYVALDGRVIDTGMLANPIDDMRAMQFLMQFPRYLGEIRSLFKHPGIKVIELTAERLTPRPGMGGGATAEFVNVALGSLYVISRISGVKHITPVMPQQWKGWLGRLSSGKAKIDNAASCFGFPQVTKIVRKSDNFPILDHQFDSVGIGLWHVCNRGFKSMPNNDQQKALSNCMKSLKILWKARLKNVRCP